MTDLDNAIQKARDAVASASEPEIKVSQIDGLSILLYTEYIKNSGSLGFLKEAIDVTKQAIAMTSLDSQRAGFLRNTSHFLFLYFGETRDKGSLQEAIDSAREAIVLLPKTDPERAGCIVNLANALHESYQSFGDQQSLEEAIKHVREASEDKTNPDRVAILNCLGRFLRDSYNIRSSLKDLDEAIATFNLAFCLTPENDENYPILSQNLGVLLEERYSNTGSKSDLDESIRVTQAGFARLDNGHTHYPSMANNLASRLNMRYATTKELIDLDRSIELSTVALSLVSTSHADWPRIASDLSNRLGFRFKRMNNMSDLNKAIELLETVVKIEITPRGDIQRARRLNSLATRLRDRYLQIRDGKDLDKAITIAGEAVNTETPGHWHRAGWINTLAKLLEERFRRNKKIEDLEKAVSISQEAINVTPSGHPDMSAWLTSQANLLMLQYKQTDSLNYINEAIQCYTEAIEKTTSPAFDRIAAGEKLLSIPEIRKDMQEAFRVATITIELIQRISSRSLKNSDKHYALLDVPGIASNSASIALRAGKGSVIAMQLLETGRNILASSIQDLRGSFPDLEVNHPEMAASFNRLRAELDEGSNSGDPTKEFDPEALADQRRKASTELETLIQRIRLRDGFNDFLLPPSKATMEDAARDGPIVTVNTSIHGCDALIVSRSGIRVLELPLLSQQLILERADAVGEVSTLEWLWDILVSPILNELGFTTCPQVDSCWPHMWWIPTGPLVQFPIHAAGYHLSGNSETLIDRAIISYSTSIKAVIYGRSRPLPNISDKSSQKVVLVAMETTPCQATLQNAIKEIDEVREICLRKELQVIQPEPIKEKMTLAIESATIFHFAGHGSANPKDLLQSHLLLTDWQTNPFTVEHILNIKHMSTSPVLAFLSACSTSSVLHKQSLDENVHLTAAFQLAGFRHVIGTLWNVQDEICVEVASMTYEGIFKTKSEYQDIAASFHRCIRALRDQWAGVETAVGQRRNIECVSGTSNSPPIWVPFIHFGV